MRPYDYNGEMDAERLMKALEDTKAQLEQDMGKAKKS